MGDYKSMNDKCAALKKIKAYYNEMEAPKKVSESTYEQLEFKIRSLAPDLTNRNSEIAEIIKTIAGFFDYEV